MDNIPDCVKIGTRKYKIIPDTVVRADGNGGDVVYRWNKIRIDPDLPGEEVKITLIHEIIHVVLWRMGNELHTDELFVMALSQWFYEIIKENSEFVKWMNNS